MIIVKNTKELQEKYELNNIPDDQQIMVLGGLAGKDKYNAEKYKQRVTYKASDIKLIINEMEEIEKNIPKKWNEWQRAKYIYERLGERISYNFNSNEYGNQQSSNLTILLSRKGICAGYSLLYKEMMDRQGISCDYIRGQVPAVVGNDRHAWNVLQINGYNIPVDLIWDSPKITQRKVIRIFWRLQW